MDSNGGNASRITALEGEEINPRVSPDGKWLAFSSNQYGNYDVYLMPVEGGTIKQLTFHTGKDEVENWGWDSKTIYFTSSRNNNFGSFKTTIEGKTPQKLFNNYFNNTNGLAETPAGNIYLQVLWKVRIRLTANVTKERTIPIFWAIIQRLILLNNTPITKEKILIQV